jgi:hypothetical protein
MPLILLMVKTYIKFKFSKDDKKINENFSCTK